MKNLKIAFSAIILLLAFYSNAQVDTTRTSTTTTTTVVTGTEQTQPEATPAVEPAPAAAPVAKADDTDPDSDYPKFYFGFRFMPTFTKFDVQTVGEGAAKTTFVVGYGFGGLIGYNISRNVGIQGEVIYSKLSQKYTEKNLERRIDLSYIHIPLMLVLNTDVAKPVNFNIALGPQIGINTGSSLDSDASNGVDTVTAVIAVKPADLGLAYGAGLDFNFNDAVSVGIGFRGVYGILDISDNNKTATTNQHYILDRSHVKTYAGYVGFKFLF